MPPSAPRPCREGCGAKVILARLDTGARWVPLEAHAVTGDLAAGALYLVDDTAWRLPDLVEHFMTRFEIGEERARDLAADYPTHRLHAHTDEEPAASRQPTGARP